MDASANRSLLLGAGALLLVALAGEAISRASRGLRSTATICIGRNDGNWKVTLHWDSGIPNGSFNAFVNSDPLTDVNVFLNASVQVHDPHDQGRGERPVRGC